jgi:hypothetical protein
MYINIILKNNIIKITSKITIENILNLVKRLSFCSNLSNIVINIIINKFKKTNVVYLSVL